MGLSPPGDVLVVVAIGDRPAHRQKQKLGQRVGDAMGLTLVFDDRKMIQQHPKARAVPKSGGERSMAASPNQPAYRFTSPVNPQSALT